jgi:hypothetical protein
MKESGDSFSGRWCSTGTMKTNLLLLCLALTACQSVVGNGNVVTSEREVGSFRRISVASGIDVVTTTGPRALTIRTDDNLQSLVETVVQNDTLVVRLEPYTFIGFSRINVELSNDLFEAVEASGGSNVKMTATPIQKLEINASGGSDVEVTGISSTELDVDVSGGSDVTLTGNASSGVVTAAGSSTLRLTGVPLESLQLDTSGGSTLNARVSSTLTGSVSGGSTVIIVGTPSNRVDQSGGSQVSLGAL